MHAKKCQHIGGIAETLEVFPHDFDGQDDSKDKT